MAEDVKHELDARPDLAVKSPWSLNGFKDLLLKTYDEWSNDNAPRLGAALAFYTMLSIAPLLIVVTAVAGLLFGDEAASGQLRYQLATLIGNDAAETIQSMVANAHQRDTGIFATVVGVITLFLGASSVVAELRSAMNQIWDVPVDNSATGIKAFTDLIRERSYAFLLVLGVGFLLLVSLVLTAGIAAIGAYTNRILPMPEPVFQALNFLVPFVVITLLFALMFKVLPDVSVQWKDVLVGAAATALLFSLGKLLIGLYLGKSSVGSTYGAAGSLVVVLIWIYYSAQIFFFGAEFTQVYANQHGSHKSFRHRPIRFPNLRQLKLQPLGKRTHKPAPVEAAEVASGLSGLLGPSVNAQVPEKRAKDRQDAPRS